MSIYRHARVTTRFVDLGAAFVPLRGDQPDQRVYTDCTLSLTSRSVSKLPSLRRKLTVKIRISLSVFRSTGPGRRSSNCS